MRKNKLVRTSTLLSFSLKSTLPQTATSMKKEKGEALLAFCDLHNPNVAPCSLDTRPPPPLSHGMKPGKLSKSYSMMATPPKTLVAYWR